MSFDPLIKALEENPALAEELTNAKTPRERDAILDAHGIEKPGPDSQYPVGGREYGDYRFYRPEVQRPPLSGWLDD